MQGQLDVRSRLDEARKKEVQQNRGVLRPIVNTILNRACQNISLRGHRGEFGSIAADGEEPALNDGNLRALLRYRRRF